MPFLFSFIDGLLRPGRLIEKEFGGLAPKAIERLEVGFEGAMAIIMSPKDTL